MQANAEPDILRATPEMGRREFDPEGRMQHQNHHHHHYESGSALGKRRITTES